MIVLMVLLSLAAVLQQSSGNRDFAESTSKTENQKEIVDKHNSLRRAVRPGASNMIQVEWFSKGADNAKHWADKCSFNHSQVKLRTAGDLKCGENIYMSTDPSSWSKVIQTWYDEEKNFKYGIGAKTKNAVTGHYTQVVWHKSYLVGCAAAKCSSIFKYFYVCHYCPEGNLIPTIATPYKSGPACGDCPSSCVNGLCTCKSGTKGANCKI